MDLLGQGIDALDTPCLLIDLDRLQRNIERMAAVARAAGVRLRPHVKTHKIPAIARMQLDAGAAGITVAKLSEAEVFADHGCTDIFQAYTLVGEQKWRHAADLARRIRLIVGADSLEALRGLSAAAQAAGSTVGVRIEVDTGLHRAGVQPDQAQALCEAALRLPGLDLDGLFTFRGPRFSEHRGRSLAELGREEGETLVALAEALRARGIPIAAVSAGGTPTGPYVAQVPGITEIRPGTYVFMDNMQTAMGVCTPDDIALHILCTVVSRPAADVATIDGGSKTFCGDIVPASLGLQGYGTAPGHDLFVQSMSEEHGVLRLGLGENPPVGERLAMVPNHVCTTVNLSDELIGVRGGRIEQVWPVLARGKRQ